MGERDSTYGLIAFTDSSKYIYGSVIYVQNLITNDLNFLMAKNKIVNKQLESKSIPSLEFMGVVLGTETLVDLKRELSGSQSVCPIDISSMTLYSDSLVCLSWIYSFVNKLDKMNKQSVFIRNRLEKLTQLCPVNFTFVDGIHNPADCITKPMSYKQLSKSGYLSGPEFLLSGDSPLSRADILNITIPNPILVESNGESPVQGLSTFVGVVSSSHNVSATAHIVSVDNFSEFRHLLLVHEKVLLFVDKLKRRIKLKYPDRYGNLVVLDNVSESAAAFLVRTEQHCQFAEVFDYFSKKSPCIKDMPNLVMQLNIFIDREGILRVGSKMLKSKCYGINYFPVLLPNNSHLTRLIIESTHAKLSHGGVYSVLTELRRKFWISHCFSTAKRVLRLCVHCRRFNGRTIKLNQSDYTQRELFSCHNSR